MRIMPRGYSRRRTRRRFKKKIIIAFRTLLIKDIKRAGSITSLKARVQELYPAKHPKIKQFGMLSDGTGKIRFVNWTSSNQPQVKKDNHYFFKKVKINYNKRTGKLEVHLARYTKILPLSK